MKLIFILMFSFISVSSIAQIDYKKKLDSLTTVHNVCIIESSIRNHRIKMDQLKKQKQTLETQLSEVQSFKLGRTEEEKEEQLAEINKQIEANAEAYTNATVHLTTLINNLVLANEEVKELQNQ